LERKSNSKSQKVKDSAHSGSSKSTGIVTIAAAKIAAAAQHWSAIVPNQRKQTSSSTKSTQISPVAAKIAAAAAQHWTATAALQERG
jgi:hypothetical protein